MFQDSLQKAFAYGAAVKLRVLKINPAKKLYEQVGFKIYLEADTTYEMRTSIL